MSGNTTDKKKLLIIDLNEQNRKELCALLSDAYHTVEAASVEDGVEILKENGSALAAILLNIDRPRTDLDTFLQIANDHTSFSAVPILLIADTLSPDTLTFLGRGVTDCIRKPFVREIILNRISNAINLNDSLTFYAIEKMLKQLPSNIYLKDSEGKYVFATHYWHHLANKDDPGWTIRGKTDPEIRKDKENAVEAQKKDQEILATGKGTSYTIEINTDGVQEFLEIIKQPLFDDGGNVTGIVGLINNVTDQELLKRKLEEKARTDELTGLFNRTYFEDYLQELKESDRYPVSIISADCDGLKSLNDRYGHLVGDDYIRMTVLLFKMVLPEQSTLFRVGGDEFTLVLPSTSREEAQGFVSLMKEKQKLFQIREQQLKVSFGIATMDRHSDSLEMCLSEADQDMYRDKKRNRCG